MTDYAKAIYGDDSRPSTTRPRPGASDPHDPHAEMASKTHPTDTRSTRERQDDEFFETRKADETIKLALTDAQRAERHRGWHDLARATGLDAHILRPIIASSIDSDMAEHAGKVEDQELYDSWRSETLADLRATYGDQTDKWLRLTQHWVEKHPALAKMLGRRGLGSRREIVIPILERVREEHLRGMR